MLHIYTKGYEVKLKMAMATCPSCSPAWARCIRAGGRATSRGRARRTPAAAARTARRPAAAARGTPPQTRAGTPPPAAARPRALSTARYSLRTRARSPAQPAMEIQDTMQSCHDENLHHIEALIKFSYKCCYSNTGCYQPYTHKGDPLTRQSIAKLPVKNSIL